MEPRWYQTGAAEALLESVETDGCHPVAAIPTGAGKTMVMCLFVDMYLSQFPDHSILVLSHVQEILEQDYDALHDYFEGHTIGLWSAGLRSRDMHQVTVAGIQSVWRLTDQFQHFDIVIIDECHLVTIRQNGMYRKFLSKLRANYIGLTATHFRLGHGYIHKGEGALFNKLAYDMSTLESFNRLVDEGYLTNLIPKGTEMRMNVKGIATRAGDFVVKGLSRRFDRESVTEAAVEEIIEFGHNYEKWLIFAIDIKHAEHVAEALNRRGVETGCVHSKMEGDRREVVRDFKNGRYRAVVNVDILTTGFDVPSIDLIGMLRPTKSPVLHVQSLGRGLRVSPGKSHCLILDFAGNTKRLGPVNDVVVKSKDKSVGGGQPMVKECPDCKVLHPIATRECNICGHKFAFRTSLTATASEAEVVRKRLEKPGWKEVHRVRYYRHKKLGKPDSVRVRYFLEGMATIDEWICPDHNGFAKRKAMHWIAYRFPGNYMPVTTDELMAATDMLRIPKRILVNLTDKYPRIRDAKFE